MWDREDLEAGKAIKRERVALHNDKRAEFSNKAHKSNNTVKLCNKKLTRRKKTHCYSWRCQHPSIRNWQNQLEQNQDTFDPNTINHL